MPRNVCLLVPKDDVELCIDYLGRTEVMPECIIIQKKKWPFSRISARAVIFQSTKRT